MFEKIAADKVVIFLCLGELQGACTHIWSK